MQVFRFRCGIIVLASLGTRNSCAGNDDSTGKYRQFYCMYRWSGAFRRARRFLLGIYPETNKSALELFRSSGTGLLNVAWHVRCGDISLHQNDVAFFERIRALFNESGAECRHFLFWEKCIGFDFLRRLFPTGSFVDADVPTALRHMQGADVLVHTGSSFVSSAALSAPATLLYLQTWPKEGTIGAVQTYSLDTAISLDRSGQLSRDQSFEAVPTPQSRRQVVELFQVQPQSPAETPYDVLFPSSISASPVQLSHNEPAPTQVLVHRKNGTRLPPQLAAAAARLDGLPGLSHRVLAATLAGSGGEDSEAAAWAVTAARMERILPGWTLRIYYNRSAAQLGRSARASPMRHIRNMIRARFPL
jgi:hypothetical protein